MGADQTLIYEARVRRREAMIAALTGVLFIAAAAVQLVGPRAAVGELTVQLIAIDHRSPLDVVAGVLQAAALLGLAWTLSFLFLAVRGRRPEMSGAIRFATTLGAVLSAIAGLVYATLLDIKAHQFVTQGSETYQQANHLTQGAVLPVFQTLDIVAQFALEIGLIMIALNAMRVGLLTRFMGYCGIVVGVAGMLLIGSPPAAIIQIFWLGALAVLFAGRWPGGDPPAWRTGQAEPWPSAAAMREQRMAAVGVEPRAKKKPAPEPAPEPVGAPAVGRTRAAQSKRKRKRRR